MLQRIESHIREHNLIEPGGEVTCLVSGGADSACLWHALGELGYRVSALHVAHGLRGAESDEDARFCREAFGAEVVEASGTTEAELRDLRYSFAADRLLLGVWREEVRAWCDARALPYREDTSNPGTKRGLIRGEILPLLERLDPRARSSLLSLADERPQLPRALERTLADLLADREGSRAADLGRGVRAVREYDTLRLEGTVTWGPWTLESDRPGLEVRGRRPGDHLAGRRKKVQDLFVDAKVPRSERDSWPVVVHGEDVVAVPGVAEAPGWEGAVTWKR